MTKVSFQGETHHCSTNNPQSDAGSDTQDTNTMTSAAASWRQQNGGSTAQWENVAVFSLEPLSEQIQYRCRNKRARRLIYCTSTSQLLLSEK